MKIIALVLTAFVFSTSLSGCGKRIVGNPSKYEYEEYSNYSGYQAQKLKEAEKADTKPQPQAPEIHVN